MKTLLSLFCALLLMSCTVSNKTTKPAPRQYVCQGIEVYDTYIKCYQKQYYFLPPSYIIIREGRIVE